MFLTAFISGGKRVFFDYYSCFKKPNNYHPKVSVQSEFQLSEKDIKFFHENGYLGPFDLISPDEAEDLRKYLSNSVLNTESAVVTSYQSDWHNNNANGLLPKMNHTVSEDRQTHLINKFTTRVNRHLDNSRLLNLFKSPAIVERCAQLLGANLILWRSLFFQIPGNSKGTQLHQSSYRLDQNMRECVVKPPNLYEHFQITCWIALTDANEKNGAMIVIPGTHKEIYPLKLDLSSTKETNVSRGGNNYFAELDYPIDCAEKKLIKMKAGQFFLFSQRVIHGSIGNTTNDSRWAVNCRIATTDTRIYSKEMLEKGHENLNFNIKDISLDNWKAVLVRGEDHFGYNRLLK